MFHFLKIGLKPENGVLEILIFLYFYPVIAEDPSGTCIPLLSPTQGRGSYARPWDSCGIEAKGLDPKVRRTSATNPKSLPRINGCSCAHGCVSTQHFCACWVPGAMPRPGDQRMSVIIVVWRLLIVRDPDFCFGGIFPQTSQKAQLFIASKTHFLFNKHFP